jgi:hypothetical protein
LDHDEPWWLTETDTSIPAPLQFSRDKESTPPGQVLNVGFAVRRIQGFMMRAPADGRLGHVG